MLVPLAYLFKDSETISPPATPPASEGAIQRAIQYHNTI
jgi:hypothetical protein